MSDNVREQLRNRAQEHAQKKKEEYDTLERLLRERVEERNASRGNLPKFVIQGSRIELGPYQLHHEFDPRFDDPTEYDLVLKVGLPENKTFPGGRGPAAVRYRLRPEVFDDARGTLWSGYVGEWKSNLVRVSSAEFVEFALDQLTAYYRKHKPN